MELYIEGKRTELAPDAVFAVTVQSNDITRPDTVQSSYSNTLQLPFTEANHAAFGNAATPSSQHDAPYLKLEALVLQDGVEVVPHPKAYLVKAGEGYEVDIFSGSVDFFELLGDKSIRDLDLSRFNFHWDLAGVMAGAAAGRTYADGYLYQLRDDGGNIDLNRQFADQLYPSVFVRTVFDQLFAEAGLKYTDFNIPLFNKLAMPFSNDKPRHTAAWVAEHSFKQQATAKVFTVPFLTYGKVDFSISFDAVAVGKNFDVALEMYLDLTQLESQSVTVTKVGPYTIKGSFDIPYLDDLSRIRIGLGGSYVEQGNGSSSNVISVPVYDVAFSDAAAFNTPWDIATNLPDISQKDFFKAVVAMFSLMPSFDPYSNTMRLVPMQQLEANKVRALDWTAKLVQVDNRPPAMGYRFGSFAQRSIFKYKDDVAAYPLPVADQQLEREKVILELPFGGAVQGPVFMQSEEIERKEQERPTTSRPFTEVTGLFGLPASAPAIGALYKVNRNNGVWPPQIESRWVLVMHVGGNTYTVVDEEISYMRKSTLPRLAVVSDTRVNVSLYNTKASVNFTENIIRFNVASVAELTWESLLHTYHKVLLGVLDKAKGVTPYFLLSAQDVANYDPAVPVWLDQYQEYFYLNSINEFTGKGPTECQLWRL